MDDETRQRIEALDDEMREMSAHLTFQQLKSDAMILTIRDWIVNSNVDPKEVDSTQEKIMQAVNGRLQRMLETIENEDPRLAALLDKRNIDDPQWGL